MLFDFMYLLDRGYGNYLMAQGLDPLEVDADTDQIQRTRFQEAIDTDRLEDPYVYLFSAYSAFSEDDAEKYFDRAMKYFPDNADVRAAAADREEDLFEKLGKMKALIEELKAGEDVRNSIRNDKGNLVLFAETALYCFLNAEYMKTLITVGMEHKAFETARYIHEYLDEDDELGLQDDMLALYAQLGKTKEAEELYAELYPYEDQLAPILMAAMHYKFYELEKAGEYLDLAAANGCDVKGIFGSCADFYDAPEDTDEEEDFDPDEEQSSSDMIIEFINDHDNLFAPLFGFLLWGQERYLREE